MMDKKHFQIADTTFISSQLKKNLNMDFATSADVVMEASGLRLEAIRVIAREQGVEIVDSACRCIDESLLAALADAHVRKLRAYFNNAKRHIAGLNGEELATFIDFCQTFKKRQSSDSAVQVWSDIDTDAIREQFIQKVHQLTPSFLSLLLDGFLFYYTDIDEPISFETRRNLDISEFLHRDNVLDKLLHSRLFYEKPQKVSSCYHDIRSVVQRITLSARYYIFSSEDDNHLQGTRNNLVINRAPAMVA